jgi:hypothetical protein
LKYQRGNASKLKISGSNEKVVIECLENESHGRAQRFFNGNGARAADCRGALEGRVVDVKILYVELTCDCILVMSSGFCKVCMY